MLSIYPAVRRASAVAVTAAALGLTASPAAGQEAVTFADVAPILTAHCLTCHRPGAIGPFSLASYAEAEARAARIAEVVGARRMPPWQPAPRYGPFHGEPTLTVDDIATIERWAATGATRGGGPETLSPPAADAGWPLGPPDLVLSTTGGYPMAPGDGLVYRNFALPVEIETRRWVRAVDVRPDPAGRAVLQRARVMLDATRTGQRIDAESAEPGYPGAVLDHGRFPAGHFLVWTAGRAPVEPPAGTAWPLDPGTDLLLQLALRPGPAPVAVSASVGLYFADEPAALTSVGVVLNTKAIDIPAGDAAHAVEDRYLLPVAVDVLGLYPYMHRIGKVVEVTAVQPDGTELGLLKIEDWDFDWQDGYRYTQPLHLPAGTRLAARFTFDNSAANPRNPSNPPRRVTFGPDLADERAEVLIQVLPILPGDAEALVANLALKQARTDILGYQARLRSEPDDARTHNDLAVRYLDVGQPALARDHLTQAMTLDPAYAEPHFNLGSLLVGEGETAAAMDAFRRATELRPDYAEAHNNLGGLLAATGNLDDAIVYYQLALQFDPQHAGAHYNLGNARLAQGDRTEAITHYRNALASAPNDAEVHNNLARALAAEGESDEAVSHYQQAIELDPRLASALIGLSWLRATSADDEIRRSTEALMLAQQAVRLVGADHPEVLDTLAAAYASEGRFEQAVETARKAAEAARATPGYEGAAAAIEDRARLYLVFRPYRTGR